MILSIATPLILVDMLITTILGMKMMNINSSLLLIIPQQNLFYQHGIIINIDQMK